MQNVSLQSTNTGLAPNSAIAPTVATKVLAAVITSSSFFIPIAFNGILIASVPELTPIELDLGWNMIAYLREEPADVVLVFQEVQENVTIVKDGLGNVYFPDWNFCNIPAMVPGEGYQLKMSTSDTLEYLSNDEEY